MLVEVSDLNRIRIERNLTYAALGAAVGVKPGTLYRILNAPNPRVHDRTLYKIQKFLRRLDVETAA